MITLLVFSSELQAQNKDPGEFLSPIPQVEAQLKSNEINRFNTFKNNKETYKSVTLVSTKDIVKYQHNRRIDFHLPGMEGNFVAKAETIEAKSLETYKWTGKFENEHEGSVLLIAEDDEVFG